MREHMILSQENILKIGKLTIKVKSQFYNEKKLSDIFHSIASSRLKEKVT